MSDKLKSNELADYFGEETFTADDLAAFYASEGEVELNENTLLSRIYNLKQKGILSSVRKGAFVIGGRPFLSHFITEEENEIRNRVSEIFPHIKFVVWNTSALDSIAELTSPQNCTIVETDKEAAESVFEELTTIRKDIFLKPDKIMIERYIPLHENPLIVKPLISEAPLDSVKGLAVPSLEKICVDLLSDSVLFSHWQGSVFRNFITRVFGNNIINKSALSRYARRRSRSAELKAIMKNLNLK